MFLFTTPSPSRQPEPAGPVVEAIRRGAEQTGTSFDYLLATAKRESALDPTAKAGTSSATGLFQFIEQTWLGMVKGEGGKLGLSTEAQAVTARADGSLTVADPRAREAILKLREDPKVAAAMAGALTQQNRESLSASLGREPSGGELYIAHVLGSRGAADLITAARDQPTRVAALDFPEAARANRNIFYARGGGRAKGAGEVYAALAASHEAGAAAAASPTALATPAAPEPGLHGLFQTGTRPGPISDAVAKIWRVNNEGVRSRTAALSYFPRSGATGPVSGAPALAETGTEAAAAASEAANVTGTADPSIPLPPPRPRFEAGAPLDLSRFATARARRS